MNIQADEQKEKLVAKDKSNSLLQVVDRCCSKMCSQKLLILMLFSIKHARINLIKSIIYKFNFIGLKYEDEYIQIL